MDLAFIPAWKRPDFLLATLQCLLRADRPWVHYRIQVDRGHDPAVLKVARRFQDRMPERVEVRTLAHVYRGNSYNVLSGYLEAVREGWHLIHLIEEDVLVGPDWFDFHRRAHALAPEAFSVFGCAWRNIGTLDGTPPSQDEDAAYLLPAYLAPGSSFTAPALTEAMGFFTRDFWNNPRKFLAETFPHSTMSSDTWTEQDGFFMRIREILDRPSVFPCVPRGHHAGFVGYNRPGPSFDLPLEEAAEKIRSLSTEELNRLSGHHEDFHASDLGRAKKAVSRILR